MLFLLSSRMIFDSQAWRSLKYGLCSCVLSSSLLISLYGLSVCPVQCLPNWNSSIKFDQPSQIFNTAHLLTRWAQYPLEERWSGQIRGHQLAWVKMLWMMWPDTMFSLWRHEIQQHQSWWSGRMWHFFIAIRHCPLVLENDILNIWIFKLHLPLVSQIANLLIHINW